jgi:hypothetical protein
MAGRDELFQERTMKIQLLHGRTCMRPENATFNEDKQEEQYRKMKKVKRPETNLAAQSCHRTMVSNKQYHLADSCTRL